MARNNFQSFVPLYTPTSRTSGLETEHEVWDPPSGLEFWHCPLLAGDLIFLDCKVEVVVTGENRMRRVCRSSPQPVGL